MVHPVSLVEAALAGIVEVTAGLARLGAHAGSAGWAGSAELTGGSAGPAAGSDGCVVAEDLSDGVPGTGLVGLLDGLDPAVVGADVLVEAIAGWERVIAWAGARQGELVRAFAAAEAAVGREEFAADAIAARLVVPRSRAQDLIAFARMLGELPDLAGLLAVGAVDAYKAQIIATEVATLAVGDQRAVLTGLGGDVAELTGPQLRRRVRRAVLAHDPGQAQERRVAAEDARRVELVPAPDAMAWIGAYLPAAHAEACFTALTALAACPAPADERGIDARRADAFTDVFTRILEGGEGPYGPLPTQQRRRPHIQVTIAATTLLGLDEAPGELAGYGPIPAPLARQIAADGTWRRLLTDPATGEVTSRGEVAYRPGADLSGTVIARDVTCCFPGCRVPAGRCDLDHIEPYDPTQAAAEQTKPGNLQALCRHHHRMKTETTWHVARQATTATTVWTTPWGRQHIRHPHPAPGPETRAAPQLDARPDTGPPPF